MYQDAVRECGRERWTWQIKLSKACRFSFLITAKAGCDAAGSSSVRSTRSPLPSAAAQTSSNAGR
jgi:hypothetical protein